MFDGKAYGVLVSEGSPVSRKGFGVCIVSGLLMRSTPPFVTHALNRQHALGPYSIAVFFTLGALASCFVGVAISYAIGQAAPMIAAPWGVAVWREFKGAPMRAWTYIGLMFAFYAAALAVIASAALRRVVLRIGAARELTSE